MPSHACDLVLAMVSEHNIKNGSGFVPGFVKDRQKQFLFRIYRWQFAPTLKVLSYYHFFDITGKSVVTLDSTQL